MINLHLFIPSLFWHDTSLPEIYHELPSSNLKTLLTKSSKTEEPPQNIEAWLCNAFNITKQQNWPIAPITLHAESTNNISIDNDYWLRADPVHLRIEQNHVLLADSQAFNISIKESKLLADSLNQHFAKLGLEFSPLSHDRWYIRLTKVANMKTCELSQVTGKNINYFLPSGTDSIFWNNISNEIQMLLHEHPINKSRSARDELTINSVWLWGGGIMPKSINSIYHKIWSNNLLSHALALASDTKHEELPLDLKKWQTTAPSGNHLIVLDTLWRKTQYNNAYGWREDFKNLEENWFSPLYVALQKGKINKLTLTSLNTNSTRNFTITRKNLWKFWCVKKPLSIYT